MRFKGRKPIFSYKDTWSLDSVLNPIIAAGLKRFKEVVETRDGECGYPSPLEIEGQNDGFVRWLAILDKMIYAFDAKEPELGDNVLRMDSTPGEPGDTYTRAEIVVVKPTEYDEYTAAFELHWKRVKEGHTLFAEYYNSLWW